jgi:3-deoxy-D-manno-octulosonate 8-phosphate phosphatase (KDO 8-P phosphatase)
VLNEILRRIRLVAFDFDGVFTDDAVYVLQDGTEAVRCFRGDGLGLRKLERLGIASVIISTESNPVVSQRARKLRVACVQDCPDKRAVLESYAAERGVTLAETAFVGNDINDLACLRCVGLPVVVRNAHPDVVSAALYQTRIGGGQGAVREICDLFERALGENSMPMECGQRLTG